MKAPAVRTVDQLTGEITRPSAFFCALVDADQTAAEVDRVHELEARIAELEAELVALLAGASPWGVS